MQHECYCTPRTWWRHQMETFSALLALCAGNSPVTGEIPSQRRVTRSFDIFVDLHLNKRLSKQSWCWWSETPTHPLWRHCNEPQSSYSYLLDYILFNFLMLVLQTVLLHKPKFHRFDIFINLKNLNPETINSFMVRLVHSYVSKREQMAKFLNIYFRSFCPFFTWFNWLRGREKWLPSCSWHFQVHFLQWQLLYLQIQIS